MIVSAHVATGAAGGALLRSRVGAVVLGAVLHGVGDAIPHRDIPSRRFEVFPSHRVEGWHRSGGIPAWAQLAGAGGILALVLRG